MCVFTYMHTYIHPCMHACIHTRIHAYMHTCIHAYIHTCIHAYMHTCIHACIHTYILIHYINLYMFLLSLCDICFPLWILCLFISVWLWEFPWLMDDLGTPRNRLEHLGISWTKSLHRWHGPQPSDDWSFPSDAHWRWGRWRRRPGENRARWHDDTTCGATCDNCDNHNQVAVILYDSRWTEDFAPLAHSKITIATVPAEA